MIQVDDFTLIIPTFNRPRMLASALRKYTRQGLNFQILVVDTSAEEVQVQNAAAVAACGARITHVRHPPSMTVQEKFYLLPGMIETAFAMYVADDDIAVLSGVLDSINFLRANSDYVACHGIYYNAATNADGGVRVGVEYATISIDLSTPLERLFALAQRYQAITYSVQRRETFLAARPPIEVSSAHFWELYNAFAIVIAGKVAALPASYSVRNSELGARPDFLGDGSNWLVHNSREMGTAYVDFRTRLAPMLALDERKRSPQHLIDLVYATFMARAFSFEAVSSQLERDGDIGPGSASSLKAIGSLGNTAPQDIEELQGILGDVLTTGWPRFG